MKKFLSIIGLQAATMSSIPFVLQDKSGDTNETSQEYSITNDFYVSMNDCCARYAYK